MQKTRTHLSKRTIVLAFVTMVLLAVCFTGTARAALSYFSADYEASFELTELEVALSENGTIVEGDDTLLTGISNPIKVGYSYDEDLAAVNTGTQDEYVRVVVNKYWTNESGKLCELDPSLIELTFSQDWVVGSETAEQVVLYSKEPLAPGDSRTFATKLKLAAMLMEHADMETTSTTAEGEPATITTKFTYTGYNFNIEAEVDAVQTHNAADAMRSAWGIDPAIVLG